MMKTHSQINHVLHHTDYNIEKTLPIDKTLRGLASEKKGGASQLYNVYLCDSTGNWKYDNPQTTHKTTSTKTHKTKSNNVLNMKWSTVCDLFG